MPLKSLRRARWVAAVLVAACSAVGAAGCATSITPSSAVVQVRDRPVTVHLPPAYDAHTPVPLVLVLHGYMTTGAKEDANYLKIGPEAAKRGFLYATPDGTQDKDYNQFWNATDACCDYFGSGIDDATYLNAVIDSIAAHFSVDRKRVYVLGHSNGAFMAYRMACDHADKIAAIVSLSGAMWNDPSRCHPTKSVGILEIHGTVDYVVRYRGGNLTDVLTDIGQYAPSKVPRIYPTAAQTVADWVAYNGCDTVADTTVPPLDLDPTLSGPNLTAAETTVLRYAAGCKGHVRVELWSIRGGGHTPTLSAQFLPAVFDFLYAHSSGA